MSSTEASPEIRCRDDLSAPFPDHDCIYRGGIDIVCSYYMIDFLITRFIILNASKSFPLLSRCLPYLLFDTLPHIIGWTVWIMYSVRSHKQRSIDQNYEREREERGFTGKLPLMICAPISSISYDLIDFIII